MRVALIKWNDVHCALRPRRVRILELCSFHVTSSRSGRTCRLHSAHLYFSILIYFQLGAFFRFCFVHFIFVWRSLFSTVIVIVFVEDSCVAALVAAIQCVRLLHINNTISRHRLLLWFRMCSIFRHSLPSTLAFGIGMKISRRYDASEWCISTQLAARSSTTKCIWRSTRHCRHHRIDNIF